MLHLELRPVGGHARSVGVLPPAQVVLLTDGHESVVELIIHSLHTGREKERGRKGGERKIEREGRERGNERSGHDRNDK